MRFQTRREKKQVEKRKEQLWIREADKQKTTWIQVIREKNSVDSDKDREKQVKEIIVQE